MCIFHTSRKAWFTDPGGQAGLVCGRTTSSAEEAMQIKEYLDFLVMLIPTCVVVGAVVVTITLL
jgi:hypothetical protein